MEFMAIVLTLLFSYTFIKSIISFSGFEKPSNLPPGPTSLPIIGNLHLLGNQPHKSLAKLAKIHGPVMSLKLGSITTLIISSATAAKEVLQKHELAFSGRYVLDAFTAHNHSQVSVGWIPVGTQWRSLRKILNAINRINNGTNQHLGSQKVQELVAYYQKANQSNELVDIGRAAFRTTLNVVSSTIFSKDLANPYQDSGKEFKEVVGSMMVEAGKPNLVDYFPMLKMIDPQGVKRRMKYNMGKILDIFEGLINERLEMRKVMQGGNTEDLLDVCLNVSQQRPGEIDRRHIKSLFLDMFIAATDTTSSTLEWAMTEVLRNPHTMAKAKKELEQVIGKGKTLEENDVMRLPYLRSIVKETLRIHPPAPLLVPRKVETKVEINNYTIAKGTQVFVNVWAIRRDLTLWDDPLAFNPERFLTLVGEHVHDVHGHDFELIPFGDGRRICPGLPLAMRMIPMMLGSLLNNFDWKLDGGIEPGELDMTERFGITLQKAHPLRVFPMKLS